MSIAKLSAICASCPHIDALDGHVASFAEMMTRRAGDHDLDAWLGAVEADDAQLDLGPCRRNPPGLPGRHQRPHPALQLQQCRGTVNM